MLKSTGRMTRIASRFGSESQRFLIPKQLDGGFLDFFTYEAVYSLILLDDATGISDAVSFHIGQGKPLLIGAVKSVEDFRQGSSLPCVVADIKPAFFILTVPLVFAVLHPDIVEVRDVSICRQDRLKGIGLRISP